MPDNYRDKSPSLSLHTHRQTNIQTGMPAAAHLPAGIPGVQAQGCEDGEKAPDSVGVGVSTVFREEPGKACRRR